MEEADEVGAAGGVHDVGKIGIGPAILSNPGRLTPSEMGQMELHPGLGAEIVARFTTSRPITACVRSHHESWDGNGYPDALAGEAIPLGARIIGVADTFDALLSKRPYRDPLNPTEALNVLCRRAGQRWDAAVVTAMFAHAPALGILHPGAPTHTPIRIADPSPLSLA